MAVETKAPQEIEIPEGFWQRESSHYPRPLTPLAADYVLESINDAFVKVFAEFGLPLEKFEFREIGGHVYQAVKPYAVGGSGGGSLPPKPVLWAFFRLHPALRKRYAQSKKVLEARYDRELIDRWWNEWRPKLVADIERLRRVDLASLNDAALAAHQEDLRTWAAGAMDIHFFLTPPYTLAIFRLSEFCREHLDYDDGQVLALLSGLSDMSSEPAIEIAKLAERVRSNGELQEPVLASTPENVRSLLGERDPEIAGAFDAYIDRYGCRALRYEVVEQTLGERPELVATLLQDELRKPVGIAEEQARLKARREDAKARALAALEKAVLFEAPLKLDDEDLHQAAVAPLRRKFEELLAEAERAYPVREDNEFFTVSAPLALLRFAALECARRLVASGAIDARDDVFFLRHDEIALALREGGQNHKASVVERREAFFAAEASDPPASYGVEPPRPPLDVLPYHWKEVMSAMTFALEKIFEPERSNERVEEAAGGELKGVAAGKGSYTGPARVIMGEEQFDKLKSGDVLVCPITSPVWSVLFAKVGALVTNSGGVLSHPAIIAREHGIPAVVATGNATDIIRDGQQVTVDGEAGIVRIAR
jgi:rifampicin phosphotransferase